MMKTAVRNFFLSLRQGLKNLFTSREGKKMDPITRGLILTVAAAVLVAMISYWIYNRTHLFDSYSITGTAAIDDVEGTQYAMLGDRLIKYSHDGVFCVNTANEVLWSTAYSMQTSITDICEDTMAIAEQQGQQVYVLNEEGILGTFSVNLPIQKICVSAGGVSALLLKDSDAAWINLYDTDGTQIASVKTTITDSGYPLDMAITPDARQMMVSLCALDNDTVTGRIAFYDFSSAAGTDEEHQIGTISYEDTIFPDVYYASASQPVAIADDGFILFSAGKQAEEEERVTADNSIVSTFYDSNNVGFVFESTQTDEKYHMQVYNLSGHMTMETDFNFTYSGIRMDNSEILMYDPSRIYIYRTSGKQKLQTKYEKEVLYFAPLGGIRSYLVITDESIDQIRIK